ncbi:MAG: sugar ABC transporter permease [Spirochaetales bacterium]|uniref:carbohydrate ABC transporter permease n=1 Tax=Bullifex sp. TaxID=2815808 RepID=UPI002A4F103C|nr:sugar ABC transporter permease [Bullifex sp.]MDD5972251.1 sugar ABC transporter permease [Spirochaetales bacterium]MDD7270575.1 sugar ABC transporter permease [Spirochaetales bacterium]MDY4067053.1 sugar ABC transporter permease [Bullifex sp.]
MKNAKKFSIEKQQARWGFAFTIPCLIFFAVFSFYPIISAFITSLTNRDAIKRTWDFIGFDNYIYLFTQSNGGFSLLNSLKATGIFTIGTFIPMVVVSLVLAVMIMQLRKPGQSKMFELAYYTPAVLSSVVAATIWMILFQPTGLFNQLSNFVMRTSGKDFQWLTNDNMLRASTIIVYFWKYIGYFTILFITGLASIPPTIYEAAIVDGSSRWHTFWKITLPLLKPTIMLVSIMAMLQCLKTFSTQYMFVQGGTAREPIDVITMNIYYTGVVNRRLGRSSAMSIILFVIMLFFTFLQFKTQKGDEDVEY